MKCFASKLDVCHNPSKCTQLNKCAYEKELNPSGFEIIIKIPCDACEHRIDCLLIKNCLLNHQTEIPKTEEIHTFTSGASSSNHKPPYECLTITLLRRSAMRMQKGMHYGKHNWKKGIADKQFILDRLNHAIEHLIKAQSEIDNDTEMTDDDLAAVVVNCMFAMEYQITKKD